MNTQAPHPDHPEKKSPGPFSHLDSKTVQSMLSEPDGSQKLIAHIQDIFSQELAPIQSELKQKHPLITRQKETVPDVQLKDLIKSPYKGPTVTITLKAESAPKETSAPPKTHGSNPSTEPSKPAPTQRVQSTLTHAPKQTDPSQISQITTTPPSPPRSKDTQLSDTLPKNKATAYKAPSKPSAAPKPQKTSDAIAPKASSKSKPKSSKPKTKSKSSPDLENKLKEREQKLMDILNQNNSKIKRDI